MASRVANQHPLRLSEKPALVRSTRRTLRIVDLFAGCGGLTLGAEMAATALGRRLNVRLAIDFEQAATKVYERNFPDVHDLRTADVSDLFSPVNVPEITVDEAGLAKKVGTVDLLMGGPPCQGHSSLNNHTRRNDPKNALYLYMVRAARVFSPAVVLIENVPAVRHDTYNGANVVETAQMKLKELGYEVADAVISLVDLGVAQKRKRHIMLATKGRLPAPDDVFTAVTSRRVDSRDLRWAIGDLAHSDGTGWDAPPKASQKNLRRMQYLIDANEHDLPNHLRPVCHQGDHSYVSMYGRLKWKEPAQTITSGYGSIGQGRYMHPSEKRALTAHEAARIQGFPDYFQFSEVTKRADLATMIGNAVPPQLAEQIVLALYKS